uniref:FMP27/BLTP2/Hobbit GFWDK motif-containing RBG unit domain-containing protein n=1 Tax=Acrobeloides nanus TaxID=290746 RepID=A0A914CAF4_9BILA
MSFFLIAFLGVIVFLYFISKLYLGWIVSKCLAKYFGCKSVKFEKLRLFNLAYAKFVIRDGLTVEIHDLRLSSSFVNQELTKPIVISIADLRIESDSSTLFKRSNSSKSTISLNNNKAKQSRIFQWLQYVGAKIKTSNIVVLGAIPDCLLHITFEALQLETYRDREGLQVELSCKLVQTKLLHRDREGCTNVPKTVSLLEVSLTGSISMDVIESSGCIKKFALAIHNPCFNVSDALFDYLLQHSLQQNVNDSEKLSSKESDSSQQTSSSFHEKVPNLSLTLNNLMILFSAVRSNESTRTMSLSIQKVQSEVSIVTREAHIDLVELLISDHAAYSHFKCAQFSSNVQPLSQLESLLFPSENRSYNAEARLFQPCLVIYQHDLAWWMDYARQLQFFDLVKQFSKNESQSASREKRCFSDNFVQEPSIEIEDSISTSAKEEESESAEFIIFVQLELNDFQCTLHNKNVQGPVVVIGIELATFSGDHKFRNLEFGVESLWCHRATTIKRGERLNLDFSRHRWGTAIAIGAGLARFSHTEEKKHLCLQLDECQLEWEESLINQISEFIVSLRPTGTSHKTKKNISSMNDINRRDSWSSIDTNTFDVTDFIVQVSAKKFHLCFTAKQSAFLTASVDDFRFEGSSSSNSLTLMVENLRFGQGELKGSSDIHCEWWNPSIQSDVVKFGVCEKISTRCMLNGPSIEIFVHFESSLELTWSPLAHVVAYEVFSATKNVAQTYFPAKHKKSKPSTHFIINLLSDSPVEFGFKLPCDHFMRWVVPSIHVQKTDAAFSISAPTFLLEMDSHIIMSFEHPLVQRLPMDVRMDIGRQEFKKLHNRTNKVWCWQAEALQIVFPYAYDFADAFEELVNAIKWIKLVHKVEKKPFTIDSPLPSDLRISIKSVTMQMDDDPFEIRLQAIYEVMMDEVFERERRKQMLDGKVAQLLKDDPLLPKTKVDALYQSLAKKDAQIYVERIRKVQQQSTRPLFAWTMKDFELHAFADLSLHGRENVLQNMRVFNPETSFTLENMEFSTLWARAVELDVSECIMQFRDYPLPYMLLKDGHFWGTLVGAEHLSGGRSIRHRYMDLPEPWGSYQINRNMCPLKFYYDLECDLSELNTTYGPCWEPCLTMVSLCWNYINSPSKDPSSPLQFWDKIRLLLHGRFSMLCKKLVTSMLASPDPYNDTELIEISWENFEFDWVTGQFRIQTDVDAFVRTASKYDDSRLLHLPNFKLNIQLDWACLGDQHDHHSVVPCAPDKLPEYSTNVAHDSYRAFRSEYLDLVMHFEVKPFGYESPSDRNCPQILMYANTFKWLDFMKNTLTMVNRPVKRGTLFANPHAKKTQLSRHFKHIQLNATLPRFFISYWMSFSSSYGFRMISNSLHLTSTMQLYISPVEKNDSISRRRTTKWKVSYVSVQLENAKIHLFGETKQAVSENDFFANNPGSFFVGLARMNYIRESSQLRPNELYYNPSSGEETIPAVHRITVHDLRASWTVENRDTCLAIADGVQKAHILKKILSNDAMKSFEFNKETFEKAAGQQPAQVKTGARSTSDQDKSPIRYNRTNSNFANATSSTLHDVSHPTLQHTISTNMEEGDEMLWKLVEEAETNLVAYSEETVEPPTDSLYGVALCGMNDVILHNWQIDLLNSQLVLKGCEKDGFLLMTAARASVSQKIHLPVWRNAQVLIKKSWSSVLSGMQYFAPLVIGKMPPQPSRDQFRWLSRDIIEEKQQEGTSRLSDKINNYSSTGEAVGGVVSDIDHDASNHTLQLQRVASRCSCQIFFCYFSDLINTEKFQNLVLPTINDKKEAKWGQKREDVDCFTLKHNMLEVCTNSDQYQMLLDILNHLVLFVDPKKKLYEENRRRLWFRLAKTSMEEVRDSIQAMQTELREIVSIIRSLERQSYFLNKQMKALPNDEILINENKFLQTEIDESKARQIALIEELAMTISCFKEKEMEHQSEIHRRKMLQEDEDQSLIARRFEVCFEDCIWRLTESDGQISITEMQIRNFLYTRTARIDNSGEHLLEVGIVKVLNLLPNSKYKETLARLPNPSNSESDRTPSIRIICRDLPPVGGISVKEHFEVNIVPMQAQITYRFYEKMIAFFFPGRNIEKADQQNLDNSEEQNLQQSFSLARRFKGAVNGSFRTKPALNTTNARVVAIRDEIDKMKERAEKNNMFVYIIVPQVPFIVSYKGSKEKNIEDVDRFHLTFPNCEYHDKNWTWLDLALAIKQRCKRMLLQQFMTQKLLRNRLLGAENAPVEPIDEEEKKRIVLGVTTTPTDKGKKKIKKG